IWKKGMILGIIALFISVSMAPALTAVPKNTEQKDTIAIELASIASDGSQQIETLDLTEDEAANLQLSLTSLLELIRSIKDKSSLIDLLQLFFNGNEYPILSKIITNLFNSQLLENRQIVVSEGWNYDLNPFKKTEKDVMKPLTIWRYAESSDKLPIPSSTSIIRFNPMETETYTGSQLGLLVRFKGIYVHIPQKLPEQSFTFFIGFARHAGAFELPTLTMPEL
ncbi:MAG: hypothetical protein R6U21_02420, partial [Thermoplasmatota archaeon]